MIGEQSILGQVITPLTKRKHRLKGLLVESNRYSCTIKFYEKATELKLDSISFSSKVGLYLTDYVLWKPLILTYEKVLSGKLFPGGIDMSIRLMEWKASVREYSDIDLEILCIERFMMNKADLLKAFQTIKEKGIENEEDGTIIVPKHFLTVQEDIIQVGIEKGNLLEYEKRGKKYITLLKDKIQDAVFVPKVFFERIKENGVENSSDQYVIQKSVFRTKIVLTENAFNRVIQVAKEKGFIEENKKGSKVFIKLLKEKKDEQIKTAESSDVATKLEELIEFVKKFDKKTVDGYLYLSEKVCKELLEINQEKFEEVIKLGIKNRVLKRGQHKDKRVIIYKVRLMDMDDINI